MRWILALLLAAMLAGCANDADDDDSGDAIGDTGGDGTGGDGSGGDGAGGDGGGGDGQTEGGVMRTANCEAGLERPHVAMVTADGVDAGGILMVTYTETTDSVVDAIFDDSGCLLVELPGADAYTFAIDGMPDDPDCFQEASMDIVYDGSGKADVAFGEVFTACA